ncbi:MAG: response regulator [Opitutaceae bacterium]
MIDDNPDSRLLLVRTLQRRFSSAAIIECQDPDVAIRYAGSHRPSAIIAHRAGEMDGLTLIGELRAANATVPIVMVSGIDRTKQALAAGATRFLHYDEWLRIGTVVADLIEAPRSSSLITGADGRSTAGAS